MSKETKEHDSIMKGEDSKGNGWGGYVRIISEGLS